MSTTLLASSNPSSFTVPNTQNTAPIIDYRCLYTHDLRRKQKRWQDGVLRYHTFNKRVMVYDVPRNYIGDTHWRDKDPVQDGDEFELDRGVLIQVGELLGSVEQDLSELLEKRRKAPNVQADENALPKQGAINMAKPTVSQPMQMLRPKSLNAVLGTSKGAVGRAAVPKKSPYEMRTAIRISALSEERPAKRQRINSLVEKQAAVTEKPAQTPPSAKMVSARRAERHSTPSKHLARTPGRVVSGAQSSGTQNKRNINPFVDSEVATKPIAEQGRTKPTSVQERPTADKPLFAGSSQETLTYADKPAVRDYAASRQRSNERVHKFKAPRSNDHAESQNQRSHTITLPASVDEQTCDESQPSGKRNAQIRLQMASGKARKKLMYRDLLPQSETEMQEQTPTASDTLIHRSENPRDKGTASRKSLTRLHQEQSGRIQARLDSHHTKALFRGTTESRSCPIASPSRRKERSSNTPPNKKRASTARRPPSSEEESIERITMPKSALHDTNLALAKMDEKLLARSQLATHAPLELPPAKVSLPKDHMDANPEPFELLATPPPNEEPLQSETQIPFSPGFQIQHSEAPLGPGGGEVSRRERSTTRQSTVDISFANSSMMEISSEPNEAILIASSQPILLDVPPSPLKPTYPINPDPTTQPTTNNELPPQPSTWDPDIPPEEPLHLKSKALPGFKQPTRRSPLKKTVSDISGMRPPPLVSATTTYSTYATSRRGSTIEQLASPWSREAWDLFGCDKDGAACGFGEFVERAGLG